MDWHYFGHAMWLAELGEIRVLFDPLLTDVHHGGVFEVEPSREIDVPALRPDFLVVSHQHNDHFDVPSLARLAALDPDTVLFTADALVAHAARRIGFRTVRDVETFSRIDLAGARLASTPSFTDEVEWGMLVETAEGVVWNQIDSYHPRPSQVRETLETASKIFERDLTRGLPLAFVRWQPVLETQGPLAERPGFPYREYAEALARIAAIDARAVVPSAAGVRQAAPYAWMNHYVYPVPHRRVIRDLALRAPGLEVYPPTTGASYRVRGGVPSYDPTGARAYVRVGPFDPRMTMFRPYEIPALVDPNPNALDEATMRERVESWIQNDLAAGLVGAHPSYGVTRELSFVVEVVFPHATDAYTVRVSGERSHVRRELDDDYDAMCTVAGSLLYEVVEGRRQWGDPLLGGMLRVSLRAYDLDTEGLAIANVPSTFLYAGMPYRESVRRAVEWELGKL